jgi:hypothetical protein
MKNFTSLSGLLLLVAACGDGAEPSTSNTAGPEAAMPNSVVAANQAAAATAPAASAPVSYQLGGNGLDPGLTFGLAEEQAIGAATAAFGAPTSRDHNDDCGEGPMDFVAYGDFQLGFQDGKLAGWSLDGPRPSLRSKSGLAIGAPRSVLGKAVIDRSSTLGPEFLVEGISGLLTKKEDKVESLWAGLACNFR